MPEILSSLTSMAGILDDVELNKISHPKNQLRIDKYGTTELAASIAEKGLLQPIIVRPVGHLFEIVAGNRRYEACKSLGWRKITCHIEELEDKEAFEIALIENIQRSTLSPIEEARAFKEYVSVNGWGGTTQLAQKIGKSVSYVTKRVALLDLPENVIESINNSVLSTSAGEELCTVDDDEKRTELAQLIAERHLSIRKIREIKGQDAMLVMTKKDDPFYLELSDDHILKFQKPIEKTILILRLALNKMGVVIDNTEEECWPIREVLLQHKNILHSQIDILIKEKKKCSHELVKATK